MTSALIGHTGFVGSNLLAQGHFDAVFNSKNIEDIYGRSFDRIVCAGAPGTKWVANSAPVTDAGSVGRLVDCLDGVSAGMFVLISTVDVSADTQSLNEDHFTYPREAYGKHRMWLENEVSGMDENFPALRIVRLPALFGPGLKKNALFDLMHGHRVDHLHPDSQYQWYDLHLLTQDLLIIEAADVDTVNLVTEPISTRELVARFFPSVKLSEPAGPPVIYDVRTKHANLWHRTGSYRKSRDEVFAEMEEFLVREAA